MALSSVTHHDRASGTVCEPCAAMHAARATTEGGESGESNGDWGVPTPLVGAVTQTVGADAARAPASKGVACDEHERSTGNGEGLVSATRAQLAVQAYVLE